MDRCIDYGFCVENFCATGCNNENAQTCICEANGCAIGCGNENIPVCICPTDPCNIVCPAQFACTCSPTCPACQVNTLFC